MTKLQIVSDLHLEFAPTNIENAGDTDILVLSGDISVVNFGWPKYLPFFDQVARDFPTVLYILGNHEYYHGDFWETVDNLRFLLQDYPNIQILDNEITYVNDIKFFGGTLWTDFNRGDYSAKKVVQNGLNDYNYIKSGDFKLNPNTTENKHKQALQVIANEKPDVVLGHHAPSWKSISPQFQSAGLLNYGYYSDLERFIEANQNIKLWTHGHVHSSHDYYLGDTRVVCNPRGYCKLSHLPENPKYNPLKVVEL